MTHDPAIGAAGGAMPEGDGFAQEYEAARAAQSDPIGSPAEEAERALADERPPPNGDLQHRWDESKAALREVRRGGQAQSQRTAALEVELSSLRGSQQNGPPDPRHDPQAALEYLHARVTEGDAVHQAFQVRQREESEVGRMTSALQDCEAEFRETVPDYDAAAGFYRAARIGELMQMGFDQAAAIRTYNQEVLETVQAVQARGLNPARYAYFLARQRGYGGRSALAGSAPRRDAGRPGDLTYEGVASLSGETFDAAFKKLAVQERDRERRG
jgi:hypothetical protein